MKTTSVASITLVSAVLVTLLMTFAHTVHSEVPNSNDLSFEQFRQSYPMIVQTVGLLNRHGWLISDDMETYRVKSGDTFAAIAQTHGVSIGDLMRANPEIIPSRMGIGDIIVLPAGADAISESVKLMQDLLEALAKHHEKAAKPPAGNDNGNNPDSELREWLWTAYGILLWQEPFNFLLWQLYAAVALEQVDNSESTLGYSSIVIDYLRHTEPDERFNADLYEELKERSFMEHQKLSDPNEQLRLARFLESATAIANHPEEASHWYRRAARQGNGDAQFALAVLLTNGNGVPRDDAQALRWLDLAAQNGSREADIKLSSMLADGRAGSTIEAEAYLARIEWRAHRRNEERRIAQQEISQVIESAAEGDLTIAREQLASLLNTHPQDRLTPRLKLLAQVMDHIADEGGQASNHVPVLAHRKDEVFSTKDGLYGIGKTQGCTRLVSPCRRAWKRMGSGQDWNCHNQSRL